MERLQELNIERKTVGTNHYKDVNDYKKNFRERNYKVKQTSFSKKEKLQILNDDIELDLPEIETKPLKHVVKKIEDDKALITTISQLEAREAKLDELEK